MTDPELIAKKLALGGFLPNRLATDLRNMAGFRNVLVHGYEIVDLAILREVVEKRLDDLLEFVKTIQDRFNVT
jgi:uncharacterized protein YutE (UPF0331/DUF86 family)